MSMNKTNNNITKEYKKMKRTSNNETRAKRIIRAIHRGATWEEAAKRENISVGYAQKIVRDMFKTETGYNNLLKLARANKKAKEEAERIVAEARAKEEAEAKAKAEAEAKAKAEENMQKEVTVVETGFLISLAKKGQVHEFVESHKAIAIPSFCVGELRKLSNVYAELQEIIDFCYNRKIIRINLRGREDLRIEPEFLIKNRTRGIVAVACEVAKLYCVALYTNSMEIEAVASAQNAEIKVVRVESIDI